MYSIYGKYCFRKTLVAPKSVKMSVLMLPNPKTFKTQVGFEEIYEFLS